MDINGHIDRTLQGDTHAYTVVVRAYQHMVYTVCLRVLRIPEEAEEATQDSFVKAYQHLANWNRTSKFSTWLYSIAYRTAVSRGRKHRPDQRSIDELPTHPTGPEEIAGERAEIRGHLDKALRSLSPSDASVLSFHYLEGLSVEEIVTVMDLSASNVKVKLHRARKKLLEVLQHELKGEARALLSDHG